MRQGELIRLLKKSGCKIKREGKEHTVYYNPKTNGEAPISRSSKEIATGAVNSILKDLGLK